MTEINAMDELGKVVDAEITETRTRFVTVEVPIDAFDSDDKLINELLQLPTDSCGDPGDVQVTVEDSNECPEFRLDLHEERWHVTRLRYESWSRRRIADLHGQIVRTRKDSDGLEFNRVTVELRDESLAPGCIYYCAGYAVVVTSDGEEYFTGVLRGFDHCYPALAEAGPIPWEVVDELDESDQLGTWNLLERAAAWLAELDPKLREERQMHIPGVTTTCPQTSQGG